MGFLSLPVIVASSMLLSGALAYASFNGVVSQNFAAVLVIILALTVRYAAESQPSATEATEGAEEAEDKPASKGKKGGKKKNK